VIEAYWEEELHEDDVVVKEGVNVEFARKRCQHETSPIGETKDEDKILMQPLIEGEWKGANVHHSSHTILVSMPEIKMGLQWLERFHKSELRRHFARQRKW